MDVFCDKKTPKNAKIFECINCDFKCFKKSDWDRHILRPKHLHLTPSNTFVTEKTPTIYYCNICNKSYLSRNGLWHNKKKCIKSNDLTNNEAQQTELINYLMKENTEFKQFMLEQNKQMIEIVKHTNNNTININITQEGKYCDKIIFWVP